MSLPSIRDEESDQERGYFRRGLEEEQEFSL